MSAHAAGPWMFLASVVPGQFVICNERGHRVDVALTYGFDHTPREANARLIASAPDLYEANKTALMVICAIEKANDWHQNMEKDIAFSIAQLRAALAKAEGRS